MNLALKHIHAPPKRRPTILTTIERLLPLVGLLTRLVGRHRLLELTVTHRTTGVPMSPIHRMTATVTRPLRMDITVVTGILMILQSQEIPIPGQIAQVTFNTLPLLLGGNGPSVTTKAAPRRTLNGLHLHMEV